jgi:hypothetical protein
VVLVDNLSTLKQRLISRIPVNLGVKQYQPVVLVYAGTTYSFVAKVTEPSPAMLVNFIGLGVTINADNRMIASIPFTVPEDAIRYGLFTLANGDKAESKYLVTTGTVDRSALVALFRGRV